MTPDKTVRAIAGRHAPSGAPLRGYEIHLGRTEGADCARPFALLEGRPEGAVSADGRVAGCYLHGLFSDDAFRRAFLGEAASNLALYSMDNTYHKQNQQHHRFLSALTAR